MLVLVACVEPMDAPDAGAADAGDPRYHWGPEYNLTTACVGGSCPCNVVVGGELPGSMVLDTFAVPPTLTFASIDGSAGNKTTIAVDYSGISGSFGSSDPANWGGYDVHFDHGAIPADGLAIYTTIEGTITARCRLINPTTGESENVYSEWATVGTRPGF